MFQVYDGSDDSAQEILTATGNNLPATFESTGDTLYIVMTTNSIVNGKGFKAAFSSG